MIVCFAIWSIATLSDPLFDRWKDWREDRELASLIEQAESQAQENAPLADEYRDVIDQNDLTNVSMDGLFRYSDYTLAPDSSDYEGCISGVDCALVKVMAVRDCGTLHAHAGSVTTMGGKGSAKYQYASEVVAGQVVKFGFPAAGLTSPSFSC